MASTAPYQPRVIDDEEYERQLTQPGTDDPPGFDEQAGAPEIDPVDVGQGTTPVGDPAGEMDPAPAPPASSFQSEIASIATPAPAPAASAGDDPQADLQRLMYERYYTPEQRAAERPDWFGTGTAGGGTITASTPGAAGTPAAPSMETLFQAKLAELMGRSTTPSDTDPEIAKTLQASKAAGQRGFDRDSAALAERMAFNGMSGSGAAESGLAGLAANRASTEQQIAANVYQDAANRRIAELQNTLGLAGNMLNAKEQRAMQLQIAQLQDATSRYGIGEGGRQFDASLAEKIREYGLDAAYRDAALGASSSASSSAASQADARLAEQQRQFNESMAWDKERYTLDANQNPILAMLRAAYGG